MRLVTAFFAVFIALASSAATADALGPGQAAYTMSVTGSVTYAWTASDNGPCGLNGSGTVTISYSTKPRRVVLASSESSHAVYFLKPSGGVDAPLRFSVSHQGSLTQMPPGDDGTPCEPVPALCQASSVDHPRVRIIAGSNHLHFQTRSLNFLYGQCFDGGLQDHDTTINNWPLRDKHVGRHKIVRSKTTSRHYADGTLSESAKVTFKPRRR